MINILLHLVKDRPFLRKLSLSFKAIWLKLSQCLISIAGIGQLYPNIYVYMYQKCKNYNFCVFLHINFHFLGLSFCYYFRILIKEMGRLYHIADYYII